MANISRPGDATGAGRTKKRRILVVDDDESMLVLLQRKLGAQYEVSTTSQAAKVAALARQQKPDLIVCDVHMPGFDGADVSRALLADPQTRAIPVLFLTGLATPEEIQRLSGQLGGRPAMSKRDSVAKLVERIEGLLA